MKTLCSIAVVGLVLLLLAVACAEAEWKWDGNRLLEACRDGIRHADAGWPDAGWLGSAAVTYNAGYCTGFLVGLLQMHGALESDSGSTLRPLFCVPEQGLHVIQATRIVLHYLETHPERLHLTQRVLVIEAFRDAFPCTPAA